MARTGILVALFFGAWMSPAQTDIDAIRYSRSGNGGSARFLAMGGAFGAVGADLGCAGTNPGGLGLYRKGDLSFTGGLRFTGNSAQIYNTKTSITDARFVFNNFGLAVSWPSEQDPDSRHLIAFTNAQLINFNGSTRMSGYTNSSSIARDMLTLGNEAGMVNRMNDYYERMAFETYVLDTINGRFISMLDVGRTVKQTRDIVTSGKMNELNFSYAYAYKDQYYVGASLGIPRLEFTSTMTHTELDDKDSMRITFTSANSYTHTYTGGLPEINDYYYTRGGFSGLEFEEYFKTTGSGLNFKIGGVARVNDGLRLGMYYHTSTILWLTDVFANNMRAAYDQDPAKFDEDRFPVNDDGFFEYRLITPSRLGLNAAFVFGKKAVLGVDYELVNYGRAQLGSATIGDFAAVNQLIDRKYSNGNNVRLGLEYNLSPLMLRAGYNMQGSPFGHVFIGNFVRHALSFGAGIRAGRHLYFDAAWVQTLSSENYFPFATIDTKARIDFSSTMVSLTAGLKF